MSQVAIIVDGYNCGGLCICDDPTGYACSPYEGYQGICWPEYVAFTDPVPPGGIITGVTATVYGSGSTRNFGGSLATTVSINSQAIGSGIQGGNRYCGDCYPLTITSPTYPNGLPGYNYGGTNQLYITVDGVSCIAYVELIFQYSTPTRGIELFSRGQER